MGTTVGLLHPGEMGASVAAALARAGSEVLWSSEGRSAASRARADSAGLEDAADLGALLERSQLVVSVCPPDAALEQAQAVAKRGFAGIYVDANAVSPATAREIGEIVRSGGARFVDGGIIGPPAVAPGSTRLYLSGDGVREVAALFAAGPLEAIPIDGPGGAASALKMCFAAYTKGTSALLMSIRALATYEGVDDAIVAEWARSIPELPARSEGAARGTARKAWRFIGEMDEIAASFAAAGLPDGFHRAAGEVYRRLSRYNEAAEAPDLAEVARLLLCEDVEGGSS